MYLSYLYVHVHIHVCVNAMQYDLNDLLNAIIMIQGLWRNLLSIEIFGTVLIRLLEDNIYVICIGFIYVHIYVNVYKYDYIVMTSCYSMCI